MYNFHLWFDSCCSELKLLFIISSILLLVLAVGANEASVR